MKIFELIPCDLCGSTNHTTIYTSNQHVNSGLGNVEISIVMCNECNFIFQNPQLMPDILLRHYQTNSSGSVFTLQGNGTRTAKLLNERISFIKNFVENVNIESICDIGGGKGLLLDTIKFNKSISKYLIEPSDAIEQCKNDSICKIKSFVEEVDPMKYQFDFLMCISALEHFKNPLKVLEKFYKLISSKGYLYIEVPNSLKPHKTFAEFYSYEHVNHFTLETLQKFILQAGFYPVKIEESPLFSSIRVVAKKNDMAITKNEILSTFNFYKTNKNKLLKTLRTTIERLQNSGGLEGFAIYGAGEHTKFIIKSFDLLLDHIQYFIDSDPKKWGHKFFDKKIISPNDIKDSGIQNILISSHDFEQEIYNTLTHTVSNDINLIRLYNHEEIL